MRAGSDSLRFYGAPCSSLRADQPSLAGCVCPSPSWPAGAVARRGRRVVDSALPHRTRANPWEISADAQRRRTEAAFQLPGGRARGLVGGQSPRKRSKGRTHSNADTRMPHVCVRRSARAPACFRRDPIRMQISHNAMYTRRDRMEPVAAARAMPFAQDCAPDFRLRLLAGLAATEVRAPHLPGMCCTMSTGARQYARPCAAFGSRKSRTVAPRRRNGTCFVACCLLRLPGRPTAALASGAHS